MPVIDGSAWLWRWWQVVGFWILFWRIELNVRFKDDSHVFVLSKWKGGVIINNDGEDNGAGVWGEWIQGKKGIDDQEINFECINCEMSMGRLVEMLNKY